MQYRDLIQFEPIPSVIQLLDADERDLARQLVENYVISRRMADIMMNMVFPQLQFDTPHDNRGLLIVGNYGTGKSHLMAVLSTLAEHPDAAVALTDASVATSAQAIAGRFLVLRLEIGASERPLRDILLDELRIFAGNHGVSVTIPAIDQITNNKILLTEIVGLLQAQHDGKGILIVVDELLDYLRGRKDQALVLDLNFLREVGEVCANTRLRFIAGVQESIFDSPRFQFVADSLKRVKDRFEQVRIAREDVAFVVEARLLRKTDAQRDRIRTHLIRFAPRYVGMSEHIDRFVRLFPVHPDYLTIFEQISAIEKREVLKVLTAALSKLMDQDVPDDAPGLLSYDSYWNQILENPSWRSIPDVRAVIDKSQVLENRVQASFERTDLKPLAIRLIHALSVHRLTTSDINTPIGADPAELRDTLCPTTPPPNATSEDVEKVLRLTLRMVERTVNNQFLSQNETGQYYLDLHKDVDYDALIEQRTESIDGEQINRALFEVLAELLERPQSTYVQGFRIWEYELEWADHRVMRPGYLFFGLPSERSTAQPPRDFYLYILPLDAAPTDQQADEVLASLVPDADFLKLLRHYTAAQALRSSATSGSSQVYGQKSESLRRQMLQWLVTQGGRAWRLSYGGHTRTLTEWPRGAGSSRSLGELLNAVSGMCLAPEFVTQRPRYPAFQGFARPISRQALEETARAALQAVAGPIPTQQGQAVLEAFELLDNGALRPRGSQYANHILDKIQHQGEGQVINRAELLKPIIDAQGNTMLEEEPFFRIEPEWLLVVLMALIASGDLVLALPGGQRVDAGNLTDSVRRPLRELLLFRHIERPRDIPLAALLTLFQLLGLTEGLIRDPNQRDEGVRQLQQAVERELEHTLQAQQLLTRGLLLWNSSILEGAVLAEAQRTLTDYKTFLERLRPYNTVGKLKNVRLATEEIEAQRPSRALQHELEQFATILQDLQPFTAYLTTAQEILPPGHPFRTRVQTVQQEQLATLRDPQRRQEIGLRARLMSELQTLKQEYATTYVDLHRAARLSATQDDTKKQLLQDARLTQLRALALVTLLPRAQLESWQSDLARLIPCFGLSTADVQDGPICPRCQFRPIEEHRAEHVNEALARLATELGVLYETWLITLRENLNDPVAAEGLNLWHDAAIRGSIRAFRDGDALPTPLPSAWAPAVNDILSGLERLAIRREDVLSAIGAAPLTRPDLEARLKQFLDGQMQGRDARKVRIILE